MKNTMKKLAALLLALAMVFALAACSSSGNNPPAGGSDNPGGGQSTASFKKAKIGVGLYFDSGYYPDNVKSYLAELGKAMNVEFVYSLLTQTDEAANLTKVQEMIASGCDGIILTLDMGTPAILDECAAANVYVAGFLCDFDSSYNTNYDAVFKNDYFLGAAADGPTGDDIRAGYDYFDSLMEYNERNPEAPITHVAMTTFPAWAFPMQQTFVQQFNEKVEEYNATAATPITVDPLDEGVDVLQFSPMDSTYFSKHAGIQAIMCFCDGATFVYPTMVSAGVDGQIKLFAAGFGESSSEDFGSTGKGTFQQETVSAIEAVVYPVVLLVNKINGVEFKDMPEDAERVSCFSIIINSDEDMEAFVNKSLYRTGKIENALYSPEAVANMTAVANPDATYADLVSIMDQMTIDSLLK